MHSTIKMTRTSDSYPFDQQQHVADGDGGNSLTASGNNYAVNNSSSLAMNSTAATRTNYGALHTFSKHITVASNMPSTSMTIQATTDHHQIVTPIHGVPTMIGDSSHDQVDVGLDGIGGDWAMTDDDEASIEHIDIIEMASSREESSSTSLYDFYFETKQADTIESGDDFSITSHDDSMCLDITADPSAFWEQGIVEMQFPPQSDSKSNSVHRVSEISF